MSGRRRFRVILKIAFAVCVASCYTSLNLVGGVDVNTSGDYDELRVAAAAARTALEKLERERDELNKRFGRLIEPINMLRNVISAWESINPDKDVQPSLPEIPEEAPVMTGEPERVPKGVVGHRVEQVMSDGTPRSKREVLQEIKRRFNVDDNINSVAMALTRRAARGELVIENGRFRRP